MLIICGIVQRKNWVRSLIEDQSIKTLKVRYMDQMDEDLYFLRLGSNPVWKLMKIDLLDIATMGYQTRKAQTQASLHALSVGSGVELRIWVWMGGFGFRGFTCTAEVSYKLDVSRSCVKYPFDTNVTAQKVFFNFSE